MRKNVFLVIVALFVMSTLVSACGGGKSGSSPTAPTGIGGGDTGTGGGTSGGASVERVQLLDLKFAESGGGCYSGCTAPLPLVTNADGTYGMVAYGVYTVWIDMTNPKKAGRTVTIRVESDGLNPTPHESTMSESVVLNSTLQYRNGYAMTNRMKERYLTTVTITETGPDLAEPTVIQRVLVSYMLPS